MVLKQSQLKLMDIIALIKRGVWTQASVIETSAQLPLRFMGFPLVLRNVSQRNDFHRTSC